MKTIEGDIVDLISGTLEELSFPRVNFTVEHPENLSNGDYSSNIAILLAKKEKANPMEVAKKIADTLRQAQGDFISKIEVAKPGFINIFLSEKFFNNSLSDILKNKNFGKTNASSGIKTIVEYTDANPFKEFHIGHLMDNAIGESISRIYEWNGADVKRANYQGDVGIHVAKAVWAMPKGKQEVTNEEDFLLRLANAYAEGNRAYETDENAQKEIQDINKKIYLKSNKEVNEIYERGRKASLDYFETIYKILGTKFDYYFFESTTAEFGKVLVRENVGKVFEENDGAIIYRGETRDKSLHTRVFINKEGLPTYEAKELGLAKIKYDTYPYEISVVVTGNEIKDYFRVLLSAMSEIFPSLAQKTKHISHGMLRLPTGKMSSRTGDVITAMTLIEEVKSKAREKIAQSNRDISDKEKLVEEVAVGAIKYSILKQSIGKDIIFDLDKSLSFEGDSGPYLQYTHARCLSLVEKAKEEGIKEFFESGEIYDVEKILYRFPEVVERSIRELSPNFIATFLVELASSFNSFYASYTVVDKNDRQSPRKVAIAKGVSIILKNGLNVLGISAPLRM